MLYLSMNLTRFLLDWQISAENTMKAFAVAKNSDQGKQTNK